MSETVPEQVTDIAQLYSGAHITIKKDQQVEEAVVTSVFNAEEIFDVIRVVKGSNNEKGEFLFDCKCQMCKRGEVLPITTENNEKAGEYIVAQDQLNFNDYRNKLTVSKPTCYPLSETKRRSELFLHRRYSTVFKGSSDVIKDILCGKKMDGQFVIPSTNVQSFPLTLPNIWMAIKDIVGAVVCAPYYLIRGRSNHGDDL